MRHHPVVDNKPKSAPYNKETMCHIILAENSGNVHDSMQITNNQELVVLGLNPPGVIEDISVEFNIVLLLEQYKQFVTVGDLVLWLEEQE